MERGAQRRAPWSGDVFTSSGLVRVLGVQYLAGGVLVLVWLRLTWNAAEPWHGHLHLLGLLACLQGAVMIGLSLARLSRRGAVRLANLCILSAEVVVSFGWWQTQDPRTPSTYFLLWTTAYAGVLSRRARWCHMGTATVLLLAAAAGMPDPARAAGDLLIVLPTVFVVTLVVSRIVDRVRAAATRDPLTGLHNRTVFHRTLTAELARCRAGGSVLVLLLDLDRFKDVNDTHGHAAGDALLVEVAARLAEVVRGGELVARLGGDEFAVLVPSAGPADPAEVWSRLRSAWERPVPAGGRLLHVGGSAGVALATGADSAEGALRDADTAMYEAKRAGGGGWRAFDAAAAATRARAVAVEAGLRDALPRGELSLRYQPVIGLSDGAPHGAEALLRWHAAELGPVGPDEFIPVAETCGLIAELGRFVLETAVAQLAAWRADGTVGPEFVLGVNVSPHELDGDLVETVARTLADHGVPPRCLVVEVTESAIVLGPAAAVLTALHDLGVRLALDDFGTGFSSLTALRTHPFDTVKIDRSFVAHIATDPDDRALVQATAALARAVHTHTVVEGVEDDDQLRIVRELGCHMAQGFGIAVPATAAELPEVLARLGGPGGRRRAGRRAAAPEQPV